MSRCVYEVLGLQKDVSQETIKQTYRKLCQENHPDKGGEEEVFKTIKSAYEKISCKEKRKQYDSGAYYQEPEYYSEDSESETTDNDYTESGENPNYPFWLPYGAGVIFNRRKLVRFLGDQGFGYFQTVEGRTSPNTLFKNEDGVLQIHGTIHVLG